MRQATIFCAIVLIAACPPRRGRIVYVQRCPRPVTAAATDVVPPPRENDAKPEKVADPALDAHLHAWEQKTAGLTNFRAEIALTRTDAVFKKAINFKGVVLCMKPNFALLRLDNIDDTTKTDYEAYKYDGNNLYIYNGKSRTLTEIKNMNSKTGEAPTGEINPLEKRFQSRFLASEIDLLTGMKNHEMKERFDISLIKTDENYIYLDIKLLHEKDQRGFKHLRLALYGPGPNTAQFAYLPAQVYVLKPNDDTEVWKFSNPQVDLPGVGAKHFQYVEIKGWKLNKAPVRDKTAEPKP